MGGRACILVQGFKHLDDGRASVPVSASASARASARAKAHSSASDGRVKYAQSILFHNGSTNPKSCQWHRIVYELLKLMMMRYQGRKHAELKLPPTPLPWRETILGSGNL